MAKEDFCFTYYDGDAARDTTHMNRLERGAYHDFIISQRKFGHVTLDQVKKILGKDFNDCWPAMELIMKTDADGKFYVEWLDTSIVQMRKHAKKQSENKKGKTKANQTESKQEPNLIQTNPLGDENGNEYEIDIKVLNINESQQKIEDVIFSDQIFIEKLRSAHRDKDLKQAFRECYIHHSNAPNPPRETWQWRQKLNTWLTIKPAERKDKKQTPTKKLTIDDLNR